MQPDEKKIWFPAKRYGWGWGPPCAWQGWVVMLGWFALLICGGLFIAPRSIGLFVVYTLFLVAVLCLVCFIKGEKPRWRWGDK